MVASPWLANNDKEKDMHVTLVEINVKDDKVEQFIEVFRANHLPYP